MTDNAAIKAPTRLARGPLGLGVLTHAIHHLSATMPHRGEPDATGPFGPFMIEHQVPGAETIPDRVRHDPLVGRDTEVR